MDKLEKEALCRDIKIARGMLCVINNDLDNPAGATPEYIMKDAIEGVLEKLNCVLEACA